MTVPEMKETTSADVLPNTGKVLTRRSVLELSHDEARKFFLKQESYCSLHMPPYIVFQPILDNVDEFLLGTTFKDHKTPGTASREYDDVNYTILDNKNGKYAWRSLQIIHPALYVALVHAITEKTHWQEDIISRFTQFSQNPNIRCVSIPVESQSEEKDKAEQISEWWSEVEQRSFELALDFECLVDTDLTDCYGSIYTHSIAWALHGKKIIKEGGRRRNENYIGNLIDWYIQDMRHGQTNGIPQGSVLMDFIAEMILGYADYKLSQKLECDPLTNDRYCILRYRDDYRIYVHDAQTGERIVKHLTEVMIGLGLKLNPEKTKTSTEIVHATMKTDKLKWIEKGIKIRRLPYYKSLMVIHEHARQFPNSGSIIRALDSYFKQLEEDYDAEEVKSKNGKYFRPLVLVGIVVDIAYRNPKTYPVCSAILSILVKSIPIQERQDVMEKILKKFSHIPNTGIMEIWLQRITEASQTKAQFSEKICRLVSGENVSLWNSEWITSNGLKDAMEVKLIVDQEKLNICRGREHILRDEFELYLERAYHFS